MANDPELERLRQLVQELSERVARLETTVGARAPVPRAAPAPVAPPPSAAPPRFQLPTIRARREAPQAEKRTLESRLGSQWFNRIGIVAVLVGTSYFLKYAFDNQWIGPAGLISIVLLAGIALVIWSERFRRKGHRAFSLSLKAVGIGTMYLSLWAAFQVYHLIPSGVAFAAMVVVTAATTALALAQDAQVLAALALVGGFATPVLLSAGQNREVALFSYVAILDIGTLVVVAFRPWMRLVAGAFLGTLVLYVGWYAEYYTRAQLTPTLVFASLFFVIFAASVLVTPIEAGLRKLPALVVVVPLLNATAFFLQLYAIFEDVSKPALAWAAVALAAIYLGLSRQVRARGRWDEQSARIMYLMHVALAVGFLTAAIPLKLETHWITIGWLVESAVLLYIGYRTATDFLKILAAIALALGVFRLLLFDNFHPETLLLNARFATYVIAIAAIAWGVGLARKGNTVAERTLAMVGAIATNLLAIVTLSREVNDYFTRAIATVGAGAADQYRHLAIARAFAFSALWMAYGAVLMWLGFWRRSAFLRWQAMVLLIFTIGKVFTYDTWQLERGYRIISLIGLGVLLLAISFVYQRDWLRLSRHADEPKERSAQV